MPKPPAPVVVGCDGHYECPEHKACINQQCRDPCILRDPCGENAFCKVEEHEPKCKCPEGYLGNPKTGCRPRESLAAS